MKNKKGFLQGALTGALVTLLGISLVSCGVLGYKNVVSREEEKSTLTESDTEMDERAVEAVKAAINKAKICKKPIAGYDKEKKRAYVEYANGERKYAE